MNYSDMSDEQFEKEFRNLFGDGALVTEVFARFKDKCEEVGALKSDNDCFDKVVKELRSELANAAYAAAMKEKIIRYGLKLFKSQEGK